MAQNSERLFLTVSCAILNPVVAEARTNVRIEPSDHFFAAWTEPRRQVRVKKLLPAVLRGGVVVGRGHDRQQVHRQAHARNGAGDEHHDVDGQQFVAA